MFCNKCGKQIPDQAQFCNYCGAPVNNIKPQAAAPSAPRTVEIPVPKKEKSGTGVKIIIAVVVLIVLVLVSRLITSMFLNSLDDDPNPPESSGSGSSSSIVEAEKPSLTEACFYGASYEYGFLTYGLTEVYLPGYSYMAGEGSEPDALLSPDENFAFTCNKSLEIMEISYDASDREGMIKSFGEGVTIILIDFQKYYVDDYPVIRYIARTDKYGDEKYVAELIVFPSETAKETIRLQMYARIEGGYDEINRVFDSLHIVPAEFAPTAEDATVFGYNRINVK